MDRRREALELPYVTAEVVRDTDEIWTMVAAMIDRFEAPDSSWDYNGLPEPFRAAMLEAIVGVRLHVRAGQAKAKLSRNRSEPERRRVAEELRERGTGALADRVLAMLGDHNEEDGQ